MSDLSHTWLGYIQDSETDFRKSGPDGDVTKKLGSGINYLKDQQDALDATALAFFGEAVLCKTEIFLKPATSSGTLITSPNGKEIVCALVTGAYPDLTPTQDGPYYAAHGIFLTKDSNPAGVSDLMLYWESYNDHFEQGGYSANLALDVNNVRSIVQYSSYAGSTYPVPANIYLSVTLFYKE